MVWAAKWAGATWVRRVYGPDLMQALCARAAEKGWSSYFLGGAPGVADQLVGRLRESHPDLAVVGIESPPFRQPTDEEDAALVDRINRAGPDLIWVGLGTPKQERWMAEHRDRLEGPVLLGVGAAFDLVSGTLKQAPVWMQRAGLEWAYRLAVEPRRLWRRYVLNIPRFALGLLRHPPRLVEASVQP
jgi:N-acetylglucosaminyldiphosphoundecaprenol N-acetyl-beta-D-mannosaminyltransferase